MHDPLLRLESDSYWALVRPTPKPFGADLYHAIHRATWIGPVVSVYPQAFVRFWGFSKPNRVFPTSSISNKACDSYCFASGLGVNEGYRYSNQEERNFLYALIDEHSLIRTTRDHLKSCITLLYSTVLFPDLGRQYDDHY